MTSRRLIFRIHQLLGLGIGLFLTSAGLSGSVLVWRNEIDALLHPELLRVAPAARHLPLQRVIETVRAAYPDRVVSAVQLARNPGEAVEVTLAGAGAEPLQVYVDPYRGTVLGARGEEETFTNALFAWHHTLLAGETGERVMGTVALLLLALVATGVVVWWPGMRRVGQALVIAWRAKWKRVNYDLHRAVGIWTTVFLVAVSITGSSLVFHDAYMAGLNRVTRSPPRPAAPPVEPVADREPLPADALVERANLALPGGQATYLTLPATPSSAFVVRKKMDAELHPNGRNFVHLHPWTGEVLALESALSAPVGTRAYNVLYPIHIGRWGGLPTRILHSMLGLVPLLLFVSGAVMWLNRRRPTRPRSR